MAINSRAGNGATPRETALELGEEIVAVREDLDVLLAEADRRRHEVMDGRLQLQRHTATKKFVEDTQVKSPAERRVIWQRKRLA
jgi:hypothetical protein